MKPRIPLLATVEGIMAERDYDDADEIYPWSCQSSLQTQIHKKYQW